MKPIQCVFFWLDGVLTENFRDIVLGVVSQLSVNKSLSEVREYIDNQMPAIQLGHLESKTFYEGLLLESGIQLNIPELENLIIQNSYPRYDVLNVIRDLPSDLELWLISDFLDDWHNRIVCQWELGELFIQERIIYTAKCRLSRIIPDLFYYVIHQSGYSMEHCLLIDSNTWRTVEAVRLGFPAAVFVDSTRLLHEFRLRKMNLGMC